MGNGLDPKQVVLVVEDMAEVRQMVASFLEEAGYTVIAVETAEEALDVLKADAAIDLLFTDILLPRHNGLRLAREAIMLRPSLRVLFTTGYAEPVLEKEPMVARGALIRKPYNLRALAEKIEWTLRVRRFELNPILRQLWQHWRELRVPANPKIDDVLNGLRILDNAAVVTVAEPPPKLRLKYAYFGATLVRWAGRNPVGLFIDEIASGDYREFIMSVYADVITNRRGVYAASAFRGTHPGLTERLLLPLPNDGRAVTSVLAAQTFDQVDPANTAFPIVSRSPDRADVVERVADDP